MLSAPSDNGDKNTVSPLSAITPRVMVHPHGITSTRQNTRVLREVKVEVGLRSWREKKLDLKAETNIEKFQHCLLGFND